MKTKTINEAADDFARECMSEQVNEHIKFGFLAGVEFAQRWVSVKDELPPENEMVLVKITLELKSKNPDMTCISLGNYCLWNSSWHIIHTLIEKNYHCLNWQVTHWRKIDL